ncbi:MAG: phage portal protein [Lactococcus lactis]|nr:phage portal protein [Lactococcus lactis]
MNIKSFMIAPEAVTREVSFERFSEPFVIQTIRETENDALKKNSTTTRIAKGGNRIKDLNIDKYTDALLVRCVKYPDLQEAELQAFYGTDGDAAATLKEMLFSGEYANLSQEVLELNGFDSEEDVKEEVKK